MLKTPPTESWQTRRAKAGAAERWRRDHERRARLAALDPIQYPGKIVRRVIVIDGEIRVREAILFDTDSIRDARRKLRAVLASPVIPPASSPPPATARRAHSGNASS